MLKEEISDRPDNFTFMMIDRWSAETYYDTWDFRNRFKVGIDKDHHDHKLFNEFLSICRDMRYSDRLPIMVACYNLGFPSDYDLFHRTFTFFHKDKFKNNDMAREYVRALTNQLVASYCMRTRTLNKYFKNDNNLLITEKYALDLLIETENIKDIVVFGEAWEVCLKHRPVGFTNIDLSKCNYYIVPRL